MTGKERAAFRARANRLEPVFQVGKGGVSGAVIRQTADALRARELIKVKALLETIPETPKEMAEKLAAATGAEVIQVIGGCMIFYKENPELRAAEKEKEKRKKEAAKLQKLKLRVADRRDARKPRYSANTKKSTKEFRGSLKK
ncbi:MAG: ribosome assembly RNA-binding protein YhbY [Oscillospiraceae bacterium]|nr:ribosome assembly RNA-binding protein YhbY [Oscillospiraceae bacterium]